MTYRSVEFFAGAGGAALGIHRAGFASGLLVEWSEDAAEGLRRQGYQNVMCADVRRLVFLMESKRPDFGHFSPPCQGFSSAGTRLGALDPRNGFPWSFLILDQMKEKGLFPRYATFENVPGLVQHQKDAKCERGKRPNPLKCARCYFDGSATVEIEGRVWKSIIDELKDRFDRVEWRIVESANHGVPQKRARVVILCAGKGEVFPAWPATTHTQERLVWNKWVDRSYWAEFGIEPVGEPSREEARILAGWEAEPLPEGKRSIQIHPELFLQPWQTVRQALGLQAWATETNRTGGMAGVPRSPDVPSATPVASGNALGGLLGWEVLSGVNTTGPAPMIRLVDPGNQAHLSQGNRLLRPDLPSATLDAGSDSHRAPNVGILEEEERPDWWFRSTSLDEPTRSIGTKANASVNLLDVPSAAATATEEKGARHQDFDPDRTPMRASDHLLRATGRRRLTIEECAILQSFPNAHLLVGTKSSRYKQVGNMFPPPVMEAIAREVMKALQSGDEQRARSALGVHAAPDGARSAGSDA